jgi:hypothetical protein
MTTKQRIVYGASSQWGTDGIAYTDIPEAKGIAVPTAEIEYQDATHLQSPGGYREFVPGLKDAGTIEIPCGYSSDAYELAHGYFTNGTLIHFKTTMPLETGQSTGDVFTFTGYVTPQLETNEVGDIVAMSLSVRTSGQPTFTKGSA